MENAESILVIILASVLTVFLIVAIVLFVVVIKFIGKLRELADKAKDVAGNVESATEILKKSVGPLAIGKVLTNLAGVILNRRKRGA